VRRHSLIVAFIEFVRMLFFLLLEEIICFSVVLFLLLDSFLRDFCFVDDDFCFLVGVWGLGFGFSRGFVGFLFLLAGLVVRCCFR